jgi:hypothetical protein
MFRAVDGVHAISELTLEWPNEIDGKLNSPPLLGKGHAYLNGPPVPHERIA